MTIPTLGDLSPDDFARHAHATVDWLTRYLRDIDSYPVMSRETPGETLARLPFAPPAGAEEMETILADFERDIVPGLTHWNHPAFFAYFSISASVPGIIGELLTAALDVNAMLWKTSPAATELEQRTLDWLRQAMGLADGWFGIINDTASSSTLLALAAAREAKELGIRERGMAGRSDLPTLRVYCSEHTHSSIDKAAITLGLGHENVVHIGADHDFRMRPELLADAVAADRARGFLPIAVVATVGTTSTTSIDPVPAIADIAEREKLWLHVDGAYGGVAAIAPEMRHVLDGVDRADSLVVNPHKWLFTPVDVSALYVRRPDVLKRAFSLVPEYLVTREQDAVINYMDYGFQLGHRFRALKLWMVLRAFGTDGIARRLMDHCAMARAFASWVRETPSWTVVAPVPFSLVCFRYAPSGMDDATADALNERIMSDVNASGRAYLSHTKLNGRYVLRLAIGSIRTERRHLEEAWRLLREAAVRAET